MISERQLFLQYLGQTSPSPLLAEVEKAEGVFLYSPDGQDYIDLVSGVSVSNVGHRHPEVVAAIKNQVDHYLHLMVYGEIIQSPQVQYAKKLIELLPDSLESCYFVNSGSEAIEGAMKLAKRFTGRAVIAHFNNSYHGGTHGALSVQGAETYKSAFRPLLPGIVELRYNDLSDLEKIDEGCACVIIEPIQAEAGVVVPNEGFLQAVRQRCSETGTLLVFDEVQTGFGRVGDLFALMKYGVTPDILVLAKALGGGLPLGAFIASQEVMNTLTYNPVLGHITTFGGHPLCCAAGLAALNVLLRERLFDSCAKKSNIIKDTLRHPLITEIRGEGLLLAVQLKDAKCVSLAVSQAPNFGLILDYFLFCDKAFRIAPPLIINEEEIALACERVCKLLDAVEKMCDNGS